MSLISALLILPAIAAAQGRPSTLNMTCGEAAATVASYGAAVLTTGEHTYERFVVHQGHCQPGERAQSAFAPTLDSEACNIGYTCELRLEDGR